MDFENRKVKKQNQNEMVRKNKIGFSLINIKFIYCILLMADEIMDRSNYIFKKIISNEKIVYSNYKIWNYDYDKWLMDYVIIFNFNFDIIAEKFQEIIAFPLKYDFTEEEIRRHWAFLHAARKLNIEIDNAYYNELKEKNDSLKEKEKLIEEENIKDIQKELDLEKINAERFEFSLGKKNKIEETEIIYEKNEENNDELHNANDQPIILVDPMNSNQQSEKIKDIPSTHNITEEDEDEKIFNEILNTKKYYKELNYLNFNNDDNIFPISINKHSSLPQECNIIEEDLQNTPNMDEYIHESDELNKQYEDLNTYYNFAVKSLNYYMPKLNPDKLQDKEIQPTEEEIMIKKASEQINQLILDKVYKINIDQ